MATNERFSPGDMISLPVPNGTKSGASLRIGGLNVVTQTDAAKVDVSPTDDFGATNASHNYGGGNPTGYASCKLDGAHEFTVSFAVAAVGTPIYIVTATGALAATDNTGANPLYGHALTTKGGTSGPLTVRLAN